MTSNDAKSSTDHGMTITRVFDAPRGLVFKAWTDPKLMSRWWGPTGFTAPLVESDARPGGKLRIHMQGPDGTIYRMHGVYHEVIAPERFVCTHMVEDDKGNVVFEVRSTVTFAEHNGKTKITMQAVVVKAAPEAAVYLEGMNEGWNQQLDRLAELLPTF